VRVDAYSARWLQQGFCWVYPKEVVAGLPDRAGAEVTLQGPSGEALGRGLADRGWIAVRRYRDDGGPLDAAWMAARLDRAIGLRERVVLGPDTTACRLVHGENDDLPGIRVDLWDRWVTIVLDTPAAVPLLPLLVDGLRARRPELVGGWLCWRPDPRDPRDAAGFEPRPHWLFGEGPPGGEVVVRERGLAMRVRPGEGPDTGLYLDMRDVRAWLAPHLAGRRVLNTFAYTAAFSVSAGLAGAGEVVSVDLSGPSLARARRNLEENGLDLAPHELVEDDVFKALDRFRRTGRRFDLAVVDPPSFSHGPSGTWSARQDMPRLVAAAARVLDRDGWLVVASNQGQVSPKEHRGAVADGLRKAGRPARELAFLGAPADFPAGVTFPEGHHLKVGIWALD
jgi:23S rRNA (cytosine1962-C5)-methyltransferase